MSGSTIDQRFVNTLVQKIRGFVRTDVSPFENVANRSLSTRYFMGQSYGSLALEGQEVEDHKILCELIAGYGNIGKKRDLKLIEESVNALIVKHLNQRFESDEAYNIAMQETMEKLLTKVPLQTTYFPIPGLKIDSNIQLKIGMVELLPLTDALKSGICEHLKELEASSPGSSSGLPSFQKEWDASFREVSVARVESEVDQGIAYELGRSFVEDALDFLAATTPCFNGLRAPWFEIGPAPGVDKFLAVTTSKDGFSYKVDTKRGVVSTIISCAAKERMKKTGQLSLLGMVGSAGLNQTEYRILRSSKWLGRSLRTCSSAERFIFAVNAAESLFKKGSGAITQTISDGLALILRKDVTHRQELSDNVRTLYEKRSKIVHGESLAIDDKDVYQAQATVFDALSVVLLNVEKFRAISLDDWLAQQRFGSAYDLTWPIT